MNGMHSKKHHIGLSFCVGLGCSHSSEFLLQYFRSWDVKTLLWLRHFLSLTQQRILGSRSGAEHDSLAEQEGKKRKDCATKNDAGRAGLHELVRVESTDEQFLSPS
eukprot:1158157-Pelagomonas_calceolata.AAC.7